MPLSHLTILKLLFLALCLKVSLAAPTHSTQQQEQEEQQNEFSIDLHSPLSGRAPKSRSRKLSSSHPVKFKTEKDFLLHGHHEASHSVAEMTAKLDRLRSKRNWKKWNLKNPETKRRLDQLKEQSYEEKPPTTSSFEKNDPVIDSKKKILKDEDPMKPISKKDGSAFRPSKPPNVLFILADDLGYGDLSVMPFVTKYSKDWPCDEGGMLTPQLELMAKRGAILTNFHSAAPVCSPSRVAFMTGVSPWRLGALNAFELGQDLSQRNGFLPQVTTIAEILRENGYYTFLSGKWHLGGMREEFRVDRVNHSSCQNPGPSQHGYEEYISELDGPESPRYTFNLIESSDTLRADNLHTHGHRYLYRDDIPVPLEDGNRGFLSPWPTNKEYSYPSVPGTLKAYEELSSRYYPFKGDPNPNPRDPSHQYALSDREAMDALEFMRRHQAAEPDQPWFVEVSFNAPHGPWERLDAGENVYDEILGVSKSHWDGHKCTWRGHEEKLVGTKLWKYKTMISAMDRSLGLLLSGLEELGLEKDTFVIFTSDNGPEQGAGTAGRYKQSKRSLQEGGIRVPAFFQWPGRIPANSASTAWTVSTDILPTILDVVGIAVPPGAHIDGVSLMPLLASATPLPIDSAYRRSTDLEMQVAGHNPDAKELGFLSFLSAINHHYMKETSVFNHHHHDHTNRNRNRNRSSQVDSLSNIDSNLNITYKKSANWPFTVDKTRFRLFLWHKDTERWNGVEERFQSAAYFDEVKIITTSERGCLDKIYDLKHDPFEDVNLIEAEVRRACSISFAISNPVKSGLLEKAVRPGVYDRHCQLATATTTTAANNNDINNNSNNGAEVYNDKILIAQCAQHLHGNLVKKMQMMLPKLQEFVMHGNEAHRAFKSRNLCTVPMACEVANITYPYIEMW